MRNQTGLLVLLLVLVIVYLLTGCNGGDGAVGPGPELVVPGEPVVSDAPEALVPDVPTVPAEVLEVWEIHGMGVV